MPIGVSYKSSWVSGSKPSDPTVLAAVDDHLVAVGKLDHLGQHAVAVEEVVRDDLVVPDQFARRDIDGKH